MKNLIITADDYGPVPFINAGIEEALRQKKINTVSVLMNPHGKERNGDFINKRKQDFLKLKAIDSEVNIGIHLSITSGFPVSDTVKSLQKTDGTEEFADIHKFNYYDVNLWELEHELINQIEAFKKTGIGKIDHLSCHHGILTMFKDFFHVYMHIAEEYKIPVRQPVLISREKNEFGSSDMVKDALFTAITLIHDLGPTTLLNSYKHVHKLKSLIACYKKNGILFPDYFVDTYYKNARKKRLIKILTHLPDSISEMVVHLGTGAEPKKEDVPNGINRKNFKHRIKEFDVLTEYLSDTLLSDHKVTIKSFKDIIGS